ncbi:FxSxx-COOH system tetratricopeptide repeat protein [Streptomyces cocklensis]|uniref:NB-ARC domain-containing protein n=1 Tax=Actinacidiphila cocklensis TaxID=887465 RepID=A0A9W4DT83_9ACTN|nr:FxSxx-COOH system tetratricopeptide repeat protein [Actinacidiphila cocklensis]MDD1061331.1 FxSxx-COOH system tetratricopeptide repeat protein [Actinacidiphila cocklensis]CAG6395638.1 NB-ARC domain-containing protein [Actinacidiphila cocklensis]
MGGPDSPQSWFVNRLRRLRTSSGSPTQAQLLAYDEKKVLSRSSLSDLLAGKFTKPPPWERVAAYATACVRAAHAARIDLSPEEELARLRGDHATLTDLLEAAFREVRAPAARPAGSRTRPATYRLPPRNTHFTGRDAALRELRQRLTSGDDGAMQAVHGLGGVGKTQLAVEYAYLYRSEYRYVVFVDAEDPDLVASQFASLARELGLAEVSSEQVVPQVYGRLLDHAPWLVIFDNGERPGTLLDALPSGDLGSGGHVIVTTRRRGWSSRAGVIDLEVFTRREAVELLARRVRGMTTAVADRIAEQLGDLPLALEQAAGYMDYNHTAPEDYLALLSSRLEDMIALGELPDRPAVVVATLWQLSVRKLEAEQPQARQLLEQCALLAPEPIPLDLFTGSTEPLNAAAADPVGWDTTVGALAGLGLARREATSLVLHRLVQAAVRAAMPADVRTDARVRLCRALLAAVPHDIHGDPDAWSRWQRLLPHALVVTRDEPPAECSAQTAELLRLASEFLLSIGNPSVALPLCERAVAIDESLGHRDAELGFDLITLAQIQRDRGAPEQAGSTAERALRLHESCLPADSPAIATDLATLARIRHLLGDHRAAVPLAERALRIDEAAYGPDDPYVSFDLIALAGVHLALDDPAVAVPLISRALRIREASYAPDHLYIGYALLLKARAVHALNDPAAAGLARRGAQILDTRLGRAHPKTADAFALADVLAGTGPGS